ncbi:MAG: helix-turn-helix transcriptional regulator [Clostridia bacterium]|nr:helix-turn-helix transcriptional regulator [Clostridia bacterium]
MTQGEVAETLGLQRSSYTKYETEDSEPSLDTVCKIAALFSVSLDELLLG